MDSHPNVMVADAPEFNANAVTHLVIPSDNAIPVVNPQPVMATIVNAAVQETRVVEPLVEIPSKADEAKYEPISEDEETKASTMNPQVNHSLLGPTLPRICKLTRETLVIELDLKLDMACPQCGYWVYQHAERFLGGIRSSATNLPQIRISDLGITTGMTSGLGDSDREFKFVPRGTAIGNVGPRIDRNVIEGMDEDKDTTPYSLVPTRRMRDTTPMSEKVIKLFVKIKDLLPKWQNISVRNPSVVPFLQKFGKALSQFKDSIPDSEWYRILWWQLTDSEVQPLVDRLVVEPKKPWNELKSILVNHFDLIEAQLQLDDKLSKLTQKDLYDVVGYNTAFTELLEQKSMYGPVRTEEYVSRYLNGLHPLIRKDMNIFQQKLMMEARFVRSPAEGEALLKKLTNMDLSEAMSYAISTGSVVCKKFSASSTGRRRFDESRSSSDVDSMDSTCSRHDLSHSFNECRKQTRMEQERVAKKPRLDLSKVRCYNCQELGHKSNVCTKSKVFRTPKEGEKKPFGEPGRFNQATPTKTAPKPENETWYNKAREALSKSGDKVNHAAVRSLAVKLRKENSMYDKGQESH